MLKACGTASAAAKRKTIAPTAETRGAMGPGPTNHVRFQHVVNAAIPEDQSTPAPLCISQITTTYDSRQDRLRLETADEDGRHLVLWLTRRLADRVVTALVGILESDGQPAAGRGGGASPGKTAAVAQFMQQTAADLKFRPVARERPAAPREEWLLTAISLRGNGRKLALEFRWGDEGHAGASMTIDRVRLRQWMRIMYRVYQKSGWPAEHWPQWISDDAASQLLPASSLH